MNADPNWRDSQPHQVRPTPQNHYGHPPADLAEDYHELLAVGDTAAGRFAARAIFAAIILAAIIAAAVFGG